MSSLLSPSTLVIDVRSPAEFASGHLEGATNLPLDRLAGLCAQALPDRQADIVVYCAAGGRSAMACRMKCDPTPRSFVPIWVPDTKRRATWDFSSKH